MRLKQLTCKFFIYLSFIGFLFVLTSCGETPKTPPDQMISLTLDELKQYNGRNGQPTYVAIDGDIYDISKCQYWKNGKHIKSMKNTPAGTDLTEALKESKHGKKMLKRYPIIGVLVDYEG